MTKLTIEDISATMREIDICMLTTKTASGDLESRPMTNNSQVDYDGDSYFFAYDDCTAAREIETDPRVDLSYIHAPLIGKSTYISVTGEAELIRDREQMKKHWVKELNVWFKQGLDTPGLVMIKVQASRLKYWHNYEEGEIQIRTNNVRSTTLKKEVA